MTLWEAGIGSDSQQKGILKQELTNRPEESWTLSAYFFAWTIERAQELYLRYVYKQEKDKCQESRPQTQWEGKLEIPLT